MRNKFFGAKTFRKIWLTLVLKTERQNGKKYQQCYISFAIATQGENRMNETSCPLQQFILAHNSISS